MKRKIIPYNPKLKEYARNLRNNSTHAEIKLWMHLRGKQIKSYDFHRQKPIDEYILGFFCYELMLGIEVDRYTHLSEDVKKKDAEKQKFINELGISILRFKDEEVLKNIETVITSIENFIGERKIITNTPCPSPEGNTHEHRQNIYSACRR